MAGLSTATSTTGIPTAATAACIRDRIMRSRLAGDPPDFLLTMKTGRFGLFEFHRAAELIELGRAAVRRSRDEILEHLEATERA